MTISTSTSAPSLRARRAIRVARPVASASRVSARPSSCGASTPSTRSSISRPLASSAVKPNSRVAAGFQPSTRSSRSIVTTAAGLISTSDSKYCFWRRISPSAVVSSAVRSSTRRSRVSTFSRSCAVISLNATSSVPTSSVEVTRAVASRSPPRTRVATAARSRIGRVTRWAISAMPIASRSADSSPAPPMTSAS